MRIGTINVVTFYQSIDIQKGAKWNPIAALALYVMGRPAVTLESTIYVNPNSSYLGSPAYHAGYSAAGTPIVSQGLLVHETTHVFQNQTDGFLSTAVGSVIENLTQGFAAYQYELSPQSAEFYGRAKPLQPYGVEQQAALVEDYFYSTRGIEPVGAINQSDFSNNRNAYRSICE